ncbi:betaine/proline/choline family ABC transporter ATP-binding protein [Clostridium botulinum]|uniref:betaine/proline/choline family ABC transporter ATP-binding protein n=1 Tax=unclassified Clostridium TaxID=2614128 RepID=UPI0013CB5615|nr:betaine/proline/choline family ABC transporter ATP-binding protein [Clostridium botulinum]NFI62415.1 betaine/proline/choline family ABC transporter ATP-binding protein [Clostridium botulinum]NFJ44172.1 betaine/proline/choline family ABC transporter ATP-binding protein [Clostridium botulinum]NFJ47158.1 betaine/proline/choline family ABC transporter ATP-binding protein [Clostridium botulinum]NFK25234.1 betaine/proline/choline family ABC transporter ATP-binding protein [Clostridium botulinum]
MIEFKNVSKVFKNQTVLKDVSFKIDKGELVSIIGESGCGKTTTLKMINSLIKPSSGKILIDGENIGFKDVIKLRRNMGYVIQQTGLFPHMTIRENIEIIPRLEKVEKANIEKKTYELMEMVGLNAEEYLDRYPTELSGGQQQRIGVARAFATNPEIILMDEPFSALDPITRLQLQDELIDLQSKVRKTIVFVTHDMDEAIRIADKICIMNGGRIIQYDTPENILKNPCNDFVSEFIGKNRIWSSPEFIKVKDIMIDNPITCYKNISLLKCVEKIRSSKVDSLMVIDKLNHLLGIVTAKQIQNNTDRSVSVENIMNSDFIKASPDDTIIDILELVKENKVSRLPVVDEGGCLRGIITKSSLVTTLSQQFLDTEEVE